MRNWSTVLKSACATAVAGGLLFLAVPSAAQAQDDGRNWDVAVGGGPSFTTDDFADLPFGDLAPTAGLQVTKWVTPRIGIQADGTWERWLADDQQIDNGPDMNIFHYTIGPVVNILAPENRLDIRANVAGGGTTMNSENFILEGSVVEFSETYFSANGGLHVGYEVTPQVSFFARGQAHLVFADEDDTAALATLSDEAQAFDEVWTFPTRVGFEVSF